MTAIAYKDGIMAADGAVWSGCVALSFTDKKITRLQDGSLAGCAGDTGSIVKFLHWARGGFETGKLPPMKKEFAAIVAKLDGTVMEFDSNQGFAEISHFTFAAKGYADEFLYGAMAAGATAEEAVRSACERCAYIGGEVQVVPLHEPVALRAVE